MRDQVIALWAASQPSFAAGAAASINRALAAAESHASMAVPDQAGVWLVYGMLRVATRNHGALAAVVRDIETKLRLLAEETECPMCLEPLGTGDGRKPAKVLACCHKTCAACWAEWCAVNAAPFCPLCRAREFVEVVAALASQQGVA